MLPRLRRCGVHGNSSPLRPSEACGMDIPGGYLEDAAPRVGNSWPSDNSDPSFSGEVTDDGLDSRFLEGTGTLEIGDGKYLPGVLL